MEDTMVDRKKLEELAKKLMFEMKEEEYATLEDEFKIILKQMDFIDKIEDIATVSPMTYPFDLELDDSSLREDEGNNEICFEDMKVNVRDSEDNMVKVPKVVE